MVASDLLAFAARLRQARSSRRAHAGWGTRPACCAQRRGQRPFHPGVPCPGAAYR